MKTKDLIEYLQTFPEDSEPVINVIDTTEKVAFETLEMIAIIDCEKPAIFIRIDSSSQMDISMETDEAENK